ncbi:MAG: hypothetical protein AABZ74_09300 [Cyanobacteriota bacterium]
MDEKIKIVTNIFKEIDFSKDKSLLSSKSKNNLLNYLDLIHKSTLDGNKSEKLNNMIFLKEIFLKTQNIILDISDNPKNEFLNDINSEIFKNKQNISKILSLLSHSDIDTKELEEIEEKHEKLKILLDGKIDLENKYKEYKKFNFELLEKEIFKLEKEVNLIKDKKDFLLEKKEVFEKEIIEIENISKNLESYELKKEININNFTDKIENSIVFIKNNYDKLYKSKDIILKEISFENQKLKKIYTEVEVFFNDLENKKETYNTILKNKTLDLKYNREIFDNLPEKSDKISVRLNSIDYELKNIENDLKSFINKLQEQQNKLSKNKFFL